jgi:hypothetical protein
VLQYRVANRAPKRRITKGQPLASRLHEAAIDAGSRAGRSHSIKVRIHTHGQRSIESRRGEMSVATAKVESRFRQLETGVKACFHRAQQRPKCGKLAEIASEDVSGFWHWR